MRSEGRLTPSKSEFRRLKKNKGQKKATVDAPITNNVTVTFFIKDFVSHAGSTSIEA